MKKSTSNVFRIVVGVIFLLLGGIGTAQSVLGILSTTLSCDLVGFGALWGLAINLIMFFAGLLALMKVNKSVCVVLAVILFLGFAVSALSSIMNNAGIWDVAISVAKAVCSFLFIGCVDRTSTNKSIKKKKKK